MKNQLLIAAFAALGAPFLASAQCVPSTALVGQSWAFQASVFATPTSLSAAVVAVGTFQAFPGGYLSVKETVVDTSGATSQTISRQAPASGRWMSNDTCTGGMLQFMLNRAFFDMAYTISKNTAGQTIMTLTGQDKSVPNALAAVQGFVVTGCVGPSGTVPAGPGQVVSNPGCVASVSPNMAVPAGTDPSRPGFPSAYTSPLSYRIVGTAWQGVPTACPANIGNPLIILKGLTIASNFGGSDNFIAIASFLNPNAYSGDLTIARSTGQLNPGLRTSSTSAAIPITALTSGFYFPILPAPTTPGATGVSLPVEFTYGRYTINSDCSGGELLLMGGRGIWRQVEFVFIDNTFSQIRGVVDGSPTL